MAMSKLRKCHYCGGKPVQGTFRDMNWIGEQGFKAIIRCNECHNRVEMWDLSYNNAVEKAAYFWNGGDKSAK